MVLHAAVSRPLAPSLQQTKLPPSLATTNLLCMWPEGTHCQRLQAGKRKRGTQFGPWASPDVLGPFKDVDADVVIATVRSNTVIVRGQLGSVDMDMMLDSGSSVSLVRKDILLEVSGVCAAASRELRLVTPAGEPIPVLGYVSAPVEVGHVSVEHPFVKSLIAGVILGIDFLGQHELVLDFAFSRIKVLSCNQPVVADVQQIWKRASKVKGELGIIMAIGECAEDVVNDCAIPKLGKVETTPYGLPSCSSPDISPLCHEFKELLRSTPGTTTMKQHFIPTLGPPVKIPPRRVPANYRKAVDEELHAMLEMGIIEESSSP